MTIKDTHEFINFILDKSQTGHFSPEEIDMALHRKQLSVFASFYDQFRRSNYLDAALSTFLVIWPFDESDYSGNILNCPQNMEYELGLYVNHIDPISQTPRIKQVNIRRSVEVPFLLSSALFPPEAEYPSAMRVGRGFRIFPDVIYSGVLHYLKTPVAPVYAYDLQGRNPVWKSEGSVDMEWQEPYMNLIMFGALEFLGVNLNDPSIVQYTMQKQVQSTLNPDKP